MQKQQFKRCLQGALLALLFVGSLLLRSTHHLFLHDHAHRAVCEKSYAHDGGTHIHDQRFQPDDCQICAFLFAVPHWIAAPVFSKIALVPVEKAVFAAQSLSYEKRRDTNYRRGPPA